MAKKDANGLDAADWREIGQLRERLQNWYSSQKDGGPYKIGEIYIEEKWPEGVSHQRAPRKNSRGMVRKFKVVHVAHNGMPFLKELSIYGKPMGRLRLPHRMETVIRHGTDNPGGVWTIDHSKSRCWTLDPQQMDAILLNQEFDPVEDARENSNLFKAIRDHNQKIAVNTYSDHSIQEFLRTLQAGDKVWTSPQTCYVVRRIYKDLGGYWNIEVNKNNKVITFNPGKLRYKRLYREQPRSFTKEARA